MKRFSEQNYYEILEISYQATWGEIQKAYELAKKTFGPSSIASYTLFDPQDSDALFKRIEEAYQTLSDQEKRRQYDKTLANEVKEFAQRIPEVPSEPAASPSSSAPEEIPLTDEMTGKTLKAIRERRGVSLQEIADRTRINVTYLYYIEQDNYRSLPAEVYLRNYLVQYAKMLQSDTKAIVDGFMKVYERWLKEKEEKDSLR